MQQMSDVEIDEIGGGGRGLNGWQFAGAVLTVGAAMIAVCTAPALGAIAGLATIAAVGANAMADIGP